MQFGLGYWLPLPVKVLDRDRETPPGCVLRSCHASTGDSPSNDDADEKTAPVEFPDNQTMMQMSK